MSLSRSVVFVIFAAVTGIGVTLGCHSRGIVEQPLIREAPVTREIEIANTCEPTEPAAVNLTEPLTVKSLDDAQTWFLSLEEIVRITLENSDIIRDVGGRVLTGSAGSSSVFDPALQEIDPNSGVEAALSAFDTQLNTGIFFNRDERSVNNVFIGGGATSFASNTANFNLELAKRSAVGSQYAVRNITTYDRTTVPSNLFSSAYNTAMEAEIRQPLLRGAGLEFNRLAGPNGQPGSYNGVVLARIRTDIALADFETSVRDLMREVESTYWQLYFAYRTLDARTAAYESALASWRTVQDRLDEGDADGEQEALARANYYLAKAAMQNALGGGATGVVGVYSVERDLRQLMGIPANDGRLIRPADEPSTAERIFDFHESIDLALTRRVELRRQRWTVKQRQAELIASKNFLLSQLDFVGLYRWRGFGDDLFGNDDIQNGSAFADLYDGALQGWQLGLQYTTTLGKRREFAAMRAAELRLARERAVLRNQELTISNRLSGQFAELDRAYVVAQANLNRAIAERQRLEAAQAKYNAGVEILVFVLQAQQTTADADSEYYRALVDYNIAIANFHIARGTYLDYLGVHLSEGAWSQDAYNSYAHEFRRFKPRVMDYCIMRPGAVSQGPYQQLAPRSDLQDPSLAMPAIETESAEPVTPDGSFSPDQAESYPDAPRFFSTQLPPDPTTLPLR